MRVHLVNPSDLSFGTAVITPRWLYVLAAATPERFGDPHIVDETLEQFDFADVQPGDVLGIGIHTANALRGYRIGREARDRGAIVVFGGIHPTLFPDEAREHGAAHAVVRGDGDLIWSTVLDHCEAGTPLPIYDGDLEAAEGLPANARKLKDLFLAHDGLLIAAPEYNSSITPLLKNTIDWVSRSASGEPPLACYDGKVAALMSASPGNLGGLRGLTVVRLCLSSIRVLVLPDQVAVPHANDAFAEDGRLKDEKRHAAAGKLGATLARAVAKLA